MLVGNVSFHRSRFFLGKTLRYIWTSIDSLHFVSSNMEEECDYDFSTLLNPMASPVLRYMSHFRDIRNNSENPN